MASLPTVEISQTGREVEEIIEESGRGRRKRALCQIGDLNGCLCGKVVNLGVNSSLQKQLNVGNLDVKLNGYVLRWRKN